MVTRYAFHTYHSPAMLTIVPKSNLGVKSVMWRVRHLEPRPSRKGLVPTLGFSWW